MNSIDLHIHTTASDGSTAPRDTVRLAAKQGLRAAAITDHDTVDGCAEAISAGAECGIEVIPGIELSTKYRVAVHILGYCIDTSSPRLRSVLDWIVEDRDVCYTKTAAMMRADGIAVDYAEMKERFGSVIGKPHFGQLLVEAGLAESVGDAFRRYLSKGQKYYIQRTIFPIEEAVALTAETGIAVLAHPFQYRFDDAALRELIELCMNSGLRGMECRYTGYTREQTDYLEALAEEYGLIKTGGSDYHGTAKPEIVLGDPALNVPYEWLETLKKEAAR